MSIPFDVERWRGRFPALKRELEGRPVVFFDGPAGSQTPDSVIDAVRRYMIETNANGGGPFETSRRSDAMLEEARGAVRDLLGSRGTDPAAFGANMTTLTLALARAMSRTWGPGDEIVVTRLEHDANFTPWVQAATDAGATVRQVAIRPVDVTLDLDDLAAQINPRTKLVAVGGASNAVGTINPVRHVVDLAHAVGAEVFVDAVHLAPHAAIDVEAWGCDYLVCSAYKFFGPHGVGLLWGRRERMDALPAYKLRPPSDAAPGRWETGTQNHEGIAGTLACIDYLAELGREADPAAVNRRAALLAAFAAITDYERGLSRHLITSLSEIAGVKIWGITDLDRLDERVPTVSITHDRLTPEEIAGRLAARGLFVWYGNYYALPATQALELEPHGMVRIGLLHYNTHDEIDRLAQTLRAELG